MPSPPAATHDPAVARYVAELGAQLAGLARTHGMDLLAYLLDMAVLEADDRARTPADEEPDGGRPAGR